MWINTILAPTISNLETKSMFFLDHLFPLMQIGVKIFATSIESPKEISCL